MRFTRILGVVVLGLALAGPAAAQSRKETLADIRQELSALGTQLQSLRSELVATGFKGNAASAGSTLERLDSLEIELQRLTARTEELQHRVDRVVADGTNRIGDLEFRLEELEGDSGGGGGGGNTGQAAAPLGGGASGAPAPRPTAGGAKTPPASGTQKAMGEQGDFDRARAVLGQGDFRTAADLFATFAQTYTGGPLTGEAHFYRGEALSGAGDTIGAAKAYLESYSGWPQGDKAPEALLKLGQSLAQLGQAQDACLTLEQVGLLYPGSPPSQQAAASMQSIGCR